MLPNDVPPWPVVQQQTQRWIKAGCFERLAHDLREVLRVAAGREAQPKAVILASRTVQSTPSSGARAVYAGAMAAQTAAAHGLKLKVIKLSEARRGFVLLPRRWLVERSFGWAARFRRLARDYERLASSLAGLHWLAFACLRLRSFLDAGS